MRDKTSEQANKTSEVLLPCPFCGGEAELDIDDLGNWLVRCKKCFCRTSRSMSKFFPTVSWSTRKPMQEIVERLEEYREDFMHDVYEELRDDCDNCRANRIIERFDEAIEIVKEVGGMND